MLLAACSSTPSASRGHHGHHHQSTTTTSSPPSSSSSSTSTTVPPQCLTSALSLGATFGGTAAGTSYTVFTLTNHDRACSLEGYPTLTFYGPAKQGSTGAGPRLPLTVVDSGPAATTVSLAKGGKAEFIVVYHDVPVGGVGCSTVTSVDVLLPGATATLVATLSVPVCGGSVEVYAIGTPGSERP
jgi:hypothetical protein